MQVYLLDLSVNPLRLALSRNQQETASTRHQIPGPGMGAGPLTTQLPLSICALSERS
eukprot:COSAG01_NODE_6406_length_3675_cov_458.417015_1_plen_57_part_00